jgi:nucleotide-binding universal stress UspA family protein
MKRILIATDGSEGAELALQSGFSLAEGLHAEAVVLSVRRRPPAVLVAPSAPDLVHEEARRAHKVLSDARAVADRFDVDVAYEVVEGDPVEEILEAARTRDVDLIVLGSRGLGSISGLMLGSVSNAVLHQADRPVLVAKTPVAVAAAL